MQKATIVLMNRTPKGAGFGHRIDTGEGVFIPANVMNAAKATELATYAAHLIPNAYRHDIPYMAIFVFRPEDTDQTTPEEVIDDGEFELPSFISSK